MLNISNLTVGFDIGTPTEKLVLKNFNLEVNDGEFIVLLGSNGAGKSTLFNAILGTVPYLGDITLNGKLLNKMPKQKRTKFVGVVYQDPLRGTAPNLRVYDNILLSKKAPSFYFIRRLFKLNPFNDIIDNNYPYTFFGYRRKIKIEAMEEIKSYDLGLENQFETQAKKLSGGQRQALTLYMASNSNPELLLLDEHTADLDPKTQDIVMEITNRIVSEKKVTTLMITHNLKTAFKYGTRLIILNEGKVVVDLSGDLKKNATEEELLKLYSKHFSDIILFSEK
jgi:putative ABC transport system ATP-binding protein